MKHLGILVGLSAALVAGLLTTPAPSVGLVSPTGTTTFAVIGDYGTDNAAEGKVAALVATWNPAYILATGDDYYASAGGSGSTRYDESTGAYYCAWLAGITTTGTRCPAGQASTNAFFPTMGNHDYTDALPAPSTYLDYFSLPGAGYANSSGNERYYDVVLGSVHVFVVNSNSVEPDGIGSTSTQALWLQAQLKASTSPWNIVVEHHPPYSTDATHRSSTGMRWPYGSWGADVVLSGHAHTYERAEPGDGVVYFVNGLGGAGLYSFDPLQTWSKARYNGDWGAQRVTVTDTTMTFEFVNTSGVVIDTRTLTQSVSAPVHVGGLTGSAVRSGKSAWTATVTATVHDSAHGGVVGAVVTGVWTFGKSTVAASCTTVAGGACPLSRANLKSTVTSATFRVTGISGAGLTYSSGADEAASVTVTRP